MIFGNSAADSCAWLIQEMSLLDPSDEDKNPQKKPRFRQDIAVVVVFAVMVLVYFLLEWLVW